MQKNQGPVNQGQVHVVGAGLAGIAAALELALIGRPVTLYEAANHAGGRCRSYFDKELGCRIDNGNHLLLSANHDAAWLLKQSRAEGTMIRPSSPVFPFVDLENNLRWTLRPNPGRLPWWILSSARRVPETKLRDYLAPFKLRRLAPQSYAEDAFDISSPAWSRLWRPFIIAALNTETQYASARLLWNVINESFGRGGDALYPLVPREGLSESLIDPALSRLRELGGMIRFNTRLRQIETEGSRLSALDFTEGRIALGANDQVVLAMPGQVVASLGLGVQGPTDFRPIVNAHFCFSHSASPPGFVGVIGGLIEWVFIKPGVLSVTISAASHAVDLEAEDLATRIWAEICQTLELDAQKIPPWRVVKEKRATFAATPHQDGLRPSQKTQWNNLALAGDWTQTGLPSTIEGAIRSGRLAASVLSGRSEKVPL